jgi:hypothetical protein
LKGTPTQNIRSKKRLLTKSQRLYFGNATQLKLNDMRYQGYMEYRETFGVTDYRNYDSIGHIDTVKATVDITKLMFVKRLAIGWTFNPKTNFSVEYGLDINVRFYSDYESSIYNVPNEFIERKKTLPIQSTPSFSISDPTFSLYHRIGVNYKKFTVNAGLSNGKVKMGTHSHAKGRVINIGLAYRIR